MKKIIIIFIIIAYSSISYAQQVPLTDFSFVNPYILNPAKAGDLGTRMFFLNRQQWKDISGAPETSTLSFDTELKDKNVGLGFLITIDNTNFIHNTYLSTTYNYKLKISENHFLSFAISPGIINTQIDFTKIVTEQINDPILFSSAQSSINFNANAGINYTYKKFQFGFIALNLSAPKFSFQSQYDNNFINYQLVQYFAGKISYNFSFFNDDLQLEPSLIGRSTIGLPIQFDGGLNLYYKDILLSRVGYRYNSSTYIALAFNLYNDLTVGCSYEYSTGQLSGYSGGTYEVVIGYRFNKRNGKYEQNNRKNKKEAKRIKENIENQSQNIDEIRYQNSEIQKKLDKNSHEINSLKEEIQKFKNKAILNPKDLETLQNIRNKHEYQDIHNFDIDIENQNNSIQKNGINDDFNFKNDSTILNREIKTYSYYLIVGAYRNLTNAKEGQKILIREIDLKTTVIQDSAKYFYFVCSGVFDTPKDIIKEKKRLNKLNIEEYIIGRPWTYMILEKTK